MRREEASLLRSQLYGLRSDDLAVKGDAHGPRTRDLTLLDPCTGDGQTAHGDQRLAGVVRSGESGCSLLVQATSWHQNFELLNMVPGRHVFPSNVNFHVANRGNTEGTSWRTARRPAFAKRKRSARRRGRHFGCGRRIRLASAKY